MSEPSPITRAVRAGIVEQFAQPLPVTVIDHGAVIRIGDQCRVSPCDG